MNYVFRFFIPWALLVLVLPTAWQVAAQDAEPPDRPEVELPEKEDPLVASVLQSNPTTPSEMTRAVKIFADIERTELAKDFLQKLLAANLDSGQLAALEAEFGADFFVSLGAREELAPQGRLLASAVLAAAAAKAADPQRLAGLVKQLSDPSIEERSRALEGLREAPSAAVGPMVQGLADPARRDEHPNIRAALIRLGADVVDPLTSVLESTDARLKAQVVQVLGYVGDTRTALDLLAPLLAETSPPEVRLAAREALLRIVGQLPTPRQAVELLVEKAQQYFDEERPIPTLLENEVAVWLWDEQSKRPVPAEVAPDDASRLLAARLAEAAHAIEPDDLDVRLLHLATALEHAAYAAGRDEPLSVEPGTPARELADSGIATAEALLRYAIETGHPAAATAAAEVLGRIGTAEELLYRGSEPAPLASAARHPDRRLRFAAVDSILQLQPTTPFAGSSYVTDALIYFAGTSGRARALVAGPTRQESQRVGGYLAGLGYQIDTAVTGRELIRLAVSSPDYELALVSASLEHPSPHILIQQLRRIPQTARLPVGILARSGQYDRAERMAYDDPLAAAFHRPHTPDAAGDDVGRLLGLAGRNFVDRAERQRQAAAALDWLVKLTAEDQDLFSVQRAQPALLAVLHVPKLGAKAAAALGNLGNPGAQEALADVASRWTLPLELRQAAARAFAHSIQRHGILLTSREIVRQYDRYNVSETLDVETQQVLGFILDAIEAPTAPAKQESTSATEGE